VGGKSYEVFDDGLDATEFLISANPGEPLKPLSKIASGGEISRVMLALKSILGESDNIETMVFDEIDTGIGGETAIAVASALKNLSATKQILCVTHLAQIAAVAQNHLNVEKNTDGQSTAVTVRLLKDTMEIKKEISRLLSGTQTPKTLEHAEELLSGFN
jgi:DNA repair protein RecN (Recombination protein N)